MEIKGKFSHATVFSDTVEDYALLQVKNICDNEVSAGCKISVMPDIHPGLLAPIGLTMTVGKRILPYLVGIDIGCGMTTAKITKSRGMEFKKLDSVIRDCVPSGFEIREKEHRFISDFDFSRLDCRKHIFEEKARKSLGSLGGGNHFIEIDKDDSGDFYITVHSGSRHLGKSVTDFYLNEGRKCLRSAGFEVPYELTYLENNLKDLYLNDISVVQDFAALNRRAIIDEIARGMKWKLGEEISCVHNYVDFRSESAILRKGAVSARTGERVIIPINMRDGIIMGEGKGNADWNFSSPHGAGRIMKREDVKKNFTVSAFKSAMKGICSSCIGRGTLDEAPFAYRGIDEILGAISPTVLVTKILKPVYNFKAERED